MLWSFGGSGCPFLGGLGACSVAKWSPTLCNPMDCSPPGSSVHGIPQARILEWVAMPSSRGSSCISCIGRRMLYHWATWEAPLGPAAGTGSWRKLCGLQGGALTLLPWGRCQTSCRPAPLTASRSTHSWPCRMPPSRLCCSLLSPPYSTSQNHAEKQYICSITWKTCEISLPFDCLTIPVSSNLDKRLSSVPGALELPGTIFTKSPTGLY